MDENLLQPTIPADDPVGGVPGARSAGRARRAPWNPDSIIYPAFFGGPLAGAALGLLNGRRLGLRRGAMIAIALTGAAMLAGQLCAAAFLDPALRVLVSLPGAVVWGVILLFQKRPFRAMSYRGQEPASLVGPGWIALLVGGLVEALLLVLLLIGGQP